MCGLFLWAMAWKDSLSRCFEIYEKLLEIDSMHLYNCCMFSKDGDRG